MNADIIVTNINNSESKDGIEKKMFISVYLCCMSVPLHYSIKITKCSLLSTIPTIFSCFLTQSDAECRCLPCLMYINVPLVVNAFSFV